MEQCSHYCRWDFPHTKITFIHAHEHKSQDRRIQNVHYMSFTDVCVKLRLDMLGESCDSVQRATCVVRGLRLGNGNGKLTMLMRGSSFGKRKQANGVRGLSIGNGNGKLTGSKLNA